MCISVFEALSLKEMDSFSHDSTCSFWHTNELVLGTLKCAYKQTSDAVPFETSLMMAFDTITASQLSGMYEHCWKVAQERSDHW